MTITSVLSYNLWCGSQGDVLFRELLRINQLNYDLVFFQEVTNNPKDLSYVHNAEDIETDLLSRIKTVFFDYRVIFTEQYPGFGTATLIHDKYQYYDVDIKIIHQFPKNEHWPLSTRIATRIILGNITFIHVHGLWIKEGKIDCEFRDAQSEKILELLHGSNNIIIGDLNYHDRMHALAILEQKTTNINNLFNITNTRSSLYKKYPKQADYVLTTGVIPLHLATLDYSGSDHLPLQFTFAYNKE